MAETKNIPISLDLSPESKAVLVQLSALNEKGLSPKVQLDTQNLASDLQKLTTATLKVKIEIDSKTLHKDLQNALGKDFEIGISTRSAQKEIAELKSQLSKATAAASPPVGARKNLPPGELSQIDQRRVNRALHVYRDTTSVADLSAAIQGKEARQRERTRVATLIADKRNLNPEASAEFLKRVQSEKLPPLVDLKRLGNRDILHHVSQAGIQGGPLAALLSAGLAVTPAGKAGAVIGSQILDIAEPIKRQLEQISEKFSETALNMERSIGSISSAISASTITVSAFGKQVSGIAAIDINDAQARQYQAVARPSLTRLGVGGSAESLVVGSLISGYQGRGIHLDPDELKTLSSRIVGKTLAVDPSFFENSSQAGRDLTDLALGSSTVSRTQLGVALGKNVTTRLNAATDAKSLLQATESLAGFVDAAEQSNNPAAIRRRLEAGVGSLELAGGEELIKAQAAGLRDLTEVLNNPNTVTAAKQLGSALGVMSDLGLKTSAWLVSVGSSLSSFVSANQELGALLLRNSGAIGKFAEPFVEASVREAQFADSEQYIKRIRAAGVTQIPKPESLFENTLQKIGLSEDFNRFTAERRNSADGRLSQLDNFIANFQKGTPDERQFLAEKQGFLQDQRARSIRERNAQIIGGLDRNSIGGRIAANTFEDVGLRSELKAVQGKLAADQDTLTTAADQLKNRGGERGNLQRELARAEAELKVRRQAVQQDGGSYLENQTAFAEAANRRNALKTQLENFDSGTNKIQLQLSQQGADFLGSRREAAALEQQILGTARDRLGLETERTAVLKQANDGRSLIGAKQNAQLDATGAARAENAALGALQTSEKLIEKTTAEVTSLRGKISKESNQELKAIEQQALIEAEARLKSLSYGADEDRVRLASASFQRLDAGLNAKYIGSGVNELERRRLGLNKGSILDSIRDAQLQDLILGKRRTVIEGEIGLADKNIGLLAKSTSPRDLQQVAVLSQFKDRLVGERASLSGQQAGVRQSIEQQRIGAAQSLQGLKVSADALIEAERRSKAELNNLTIAYKEQKNALADFKTGLQEAYAGQEEKLFGAAKSYVNAGGDLSKLPGFLQQAVTNPEQYEQSFALARLRGVLRESTGIDDPTLQGASLGIPTFGSRFSENLNNQQRRLENQLDISANDRDLFKTNLQNQRTDFGFKLGQAQQSGLFDSSNIFSTPVGGNNSQVDSFLKSFQQIFAQLNQASNLAVGSSLPQGGPGGLGTTAGKKFEEQNKVGGTSDPNSKTTPVAVIDKGSINELSATIAATIGNVLMSGTSSIG